MKSNFGISEMIQSKIAGFRTSLPVSRWAVLFLCLAAGCGWVEFPSHWRTHEIVVDGRNSEWQDSLTYLLEDRQSSLGFVNDDRDLYVCLISANRDLQRQAARPGLIVRDGAAFRFAV